VQVDQQVQAGESGAKIIDRGAKAAFPVFTDDRAQMRN
jgi:hypothetical protein